MPIQTDLHTSTKDWVSEIESCNQVIIVTNSNHGFRVEGKTTAIDINMASTKSIYNCFVQNKCDSPTALTKWEVDFELSNDWPQIFKLPYLTT